MFSSASLGVHPLCGCTAPPQTAHSKKHEMILSEHFLVIFWEYILCVDAQRRRRRRTPKRTRWCFRNVSSSYSGASSVWMRRRRRRRTPKNNEKILSECVLYVDAWRRSRQKAPENSYYAFTLWTTTHGADADGAL